MLKTANERLLKSMSKYMYFSAIFCLFLLLFLVYTDQGNLYVHFTNRFHVAMCQFSNRSQMTSKCGKNKEVAHKLQNSLKIQYCFTIHSKYFYSKEPKNFAAFYLFIFFRTDLIQSEASWKLSSTSDWFMSA